MTPDAVHLTANQTEVLLQFGTVTGWLRPMDLGGRAGSGHSAILAALERKRLVESRQRSTGRRGSKVYRVTSQGRQLLDEWRIERWNQQ